MSAPAHVFLIGFMGAGKTSVGRALAQRLGWNFYDLDELIEQRQQRSISAIFSELGESGFRKIESAALMQLLRNGRSNQNSVIALGGGTFVQPENRAALIDSGAITVLLNAPLEELERRCQNVDGVRPLAQDKIRFQELFASRQQAYAQAEFHIETAGKTIAAVVEEIQAIVRKRKNS
jgi:shikimate kinase